MANTVKLKRSSVSGKVPLTTDLELGELAVNTFDGKLYLKKDNGTQSIVEIGAGGGGTGGGFSNMEIITSSTTWNVPSGITKAKITVIGAGGGGSGNKTDRSSMGAFGGNGGVAIGILTGLSGSYSITVGTGGTGGSGGSGTSTGTAGGNSSFGTAISATGGGGASGDTAGTHGTGTVSSGTVIRQSARGLPAPYEVSGVAKNGTLNGGAAAPSAYSVSDIFGAGLGGASSLAISGTAYTGGGGIGGVVIIEY